MSASSINNTNFHLRLRMSVLSCGWLCGARRGSMDGLCGLRRESDVCGEQKHHREMCCLEIAARRSRPGRLCALVHLAFLEHRCQEQQCDFSCPGERRHSDSWTATFWLCFVGFWGDNEVTSLNWHSLLFCKVSGTKGHSNHKLAKQLRNKNHAACGQKPRHSLVLMICGPKSFSQSPIFFLNKCMFHFCYFAPSFYFEKFQAKMKLKKCYTRQPCTLHLVPPSNILSHWFTSSLFLCALTHTGTLFFCTLLK